MYGTVVLRSIWALDSDSAAWPMAPISFYPKPQPEPTQATGPSFVLLNGLGSGQSTLALALFHHLVLAQQTIPEQ